ncbi:hypothetical protein QTP88_026277 [Uroleucon formosanum]
MSKKFFEIHLEISLQDQIFDDIVQDNYFNPGEYFSYIFNPDNGDYSVNPDLYDTLYDGSSIDFYHLIVDQNIINNIFIETNNQQIASKVISPHSRLNKWYDTNESLLLWTGLVSLPSYDLYWSTSAIFKTEFSTFMSRNRFEILLQMIHFAGNSQADPNNR